MTKTCDPPSRAVTVPLVIFDFDTVPFVIFEVTAISRGCQIRETAFQFRWFGKTKYLAPVARFA